MKPRTPINFSAVNHAALSRLPSLLMAWLPGGKLRGSEYVVLNPRRDDRRLGSFSINAATGKWCDFASGDRGGDVVSLYAYIHGISQGAAAHEISRELGVDRG